MLSPHHTLLLLFTFVAPPAAPEDVTAMVEAIRAEHRVPALVAAAVRGDELIAIGATGVRKARHDAAVTVDDRFHIGSCTKSMTATVAAMLVEDGEISWDTTIGDALPDIAPNVHAQYLDVTLRMLLAHRSGLPEDRSPPMQIWPRVRTLTGPIHQQRLETALLALSQEPAAAPGEAMHYSNFGYVVAGAMMEEATGETWEELMQTRLFEPLGMSSAGFGPPGADDEINPDAPAQPWGHMGEVERPATIRPGPLADNPALLGPAGTVHCNITDFAKYAAFHLTRGEGTDLLEPESFDILHEPAFGGDYAMGWAVVERDWALGRTIMHDGSNGMWFAVVWIAPEINMAFVAASNLAGEPGPVATDAAVAKMIDRFNVAAEPDDER